MQLTWIEQKILGLFVKSKGWLSKPLFGGRGMLFMLHRVLPEDERLRYPLNQDLAITPEALEKTILYLKQENYRFLALDDVEKELHKTKNKQPFVVFTLDDGYADNFVHGKPIFEKFEIPFTLFVTSSFPEGTSFPWWYALEDMLKRAGEVVFQNEDHPMHFAWQNAEEGAALYPSIAQRFKQNDTPKNRNYLQGLFDAEALNRALDFAAPASWERLVLEAAHPLITLAAHTKNHFRLASLNEDEAWDEIHGGKIELEHHLKCSIAHFAYPYGGIGDFTARDVALVKQAGFKTAAVNYPGNILNSPKLELLTLPRYPLGERMTVEKLKQIRNGIAHFAAHGFKSSFTS